MRFLGERLHGAGFTVSGILLAGHRTTVEDLKTKKWQDWYQSVKEGYEELRASCKTIFVSGISMGALLAFLLAYETKSDVAALASLSTGFFFDGWNTHAWQRMMLPFVIHTPLMWIDKAATFALAHEIGGDALLEVLVEDTHTCYLGDRSQRHDWGYGCGTCPACRLRADGFAKWMSTR